MENEKIINLLNKIDTDSKHFATKNWYVINDENANLLVQIIQILLNTILEY